jgi:hemerythrin
LGKLIAELKQRTVQHFRDEEALLTSVNYPQLDSHKSIHAQLLEDFGKHSSAFEAGPGTVAPEFFNFLKLWLTAHIMHIDRKYSGHCQAAKGTSSD